VAGALGSSSSARNFEVGEDGRGRGQPERDGGPKSGDRALRPGDRSRLSALLGQGLDDFADGDLTIAGRAHRRLT
jgi:hypothetical protein